MKDIKKKGLSLFKKAKKATKEYYDFQMENSWTERIELVPTKFATVRFGNVEESRGNVFEIWEDEVQKNKPLSITHPSMERYFFHVNEAVNFILSCLPLINNGEIFVPKMKIYKISKLADKITKNQKIIGLRKGEKLKEILLTDEELKRATSNEGMWVIKQI